MREVILGSYLELRSVENLWEINVCGFLGVEKSYII